jgi:hypothetical protein
MRSILLLVSQKPPKRDEHKEINEHHQVFYSLGVGEEFMENVGHDLLLSTTYF